MMSKVQRRDATRRNEVQGSPFRMRVTSADSSSSSSSACLFVASQLVLRLAGPDVTRLCCSRLLPRSPLVALDWLSALALVCSCSANALLSLSLHVCSFSASSVFSLSQRRALALPDPTLALHASSASKPLSLRFAAARCLLSGTYSDTVSTRSCTHLSPARSPPTQAALDILQPALPDPSYRRALSERGAATETRRRHPDTLGSDARVADREAARPAQVAANRFALASTHCARRRVASTRARRNA